MRDYASENLCHDPVHGYIPFTSSTGVAKGEVSERELIDHPWVQRMRQIHQLQTAWWVFPAAEHTRFQHVVGVMHLASRAVAGLYESLRETCSDVPSRGYVESLLRMAGLLHDVGHGPFGHFFDEHFLKGFGLTHETLGGQIIVEELGELLRGVRRNPNSHLQNDEQLDPQQIAWLICRPKQDEEEEEERPRWLRHLRSLLSGIYTIDNMDFVLRDAYMSGYSLRSFDLDRLLHYSFFTEHGLTIHERGLGALIRFMGVRTELFQTVYFHRTVRAIDLTLKELFPETMPRLFPGNPSERLDAYRRLTEFSLLVDVARWEDAEDPSQREMGHRWAALLRRQVPWKLACERSLLFTAGQSETASIFSDEDVVEKKLRAGLPAELQGVPLRVDISRLSIYRPHAPGPSAGQNFLYKAAQQQVRQLTDSQLIRHLPQSQRICRVYAQTDQHHAEIASALDSLIGNSVDDLTNM